MPISHDVEISHISENEFHEIDYKVMKIVFSIHNDLGRFWDEKIYQNELVFRCEKEGFENVFPVMPIKVSYKDFSKSYYIDLLINNAIVYELKTVKSLTGEHKNQTLNYLFLLGTQQGKLVNFKPQSVESHFVSTKLNPEKRFSFFIDENEWQNIDKDSSWFKSLLINLLNDWGTFLDTNLFYDAINYFRGGEENVLKEIEITNGFNKIGKQKIHLLNSKVMFKISSITKAINSYETHLRKFIRYLPLKALQWINFNHNRISFKTIYN